VVIEAKHLCMMMRGVEKQNSVIENIVLARCFQKKRATPGENGRFFEISFLPLAFFFFQKTGGIFF